VLDGPGVLETAMRVRAGQRRHLVTLSNPAAPVADGDGGFTEASSALSPASVWAEIKPATVKNLERVVANTVQAQASHLVTLPYHDGITTETKVTYGTRVFSVTGIANPEERNLELVLLCQEVVP